MKNRTIPFLFIVFLLLFFSSCATKKSYSYLQDMDEMKEYPILQKYEAVIHRDDKLAIVVNSTNSELAIPFNIPGDVGSYSMSNEMQITSNQNVKAENRSLKGYLVDINGDIDFPIIGKIHVEGLTRNQLTQLIKQKIKDGNYIKEPIVFVDFLNFKFSALGEVNNNGCFTVDGDRITILEALAMAGDLTNNANISKVAVLREYGNTRRIFYNDLHSNSIFSSPCYYLQQNDIIYVEPTSDKGAEKSQRRLQIWSVLLSFVSSMATLTFLFFK